MPYESFTLSQLQEKFALTYQQTDKSFDHIAPQVPGDWLTGMLRRQAPLAVGKTSDKGRSELLITPMLVAVRELRERQIMLFSGERFDVDRKAGLFGCCNFLFTRGEVAGEITAPVIAVVEARKESNRGVPRCVAEMVAAQRFNERAKHPASPVYGAVTNGTLWRFLKLEGATVTLDIQQFGISELPRILGILYFMTS